MREKCVDKQTNILSNDLGVELLVKKAIVLFGIPPHIKGYQYIREALLILIEYSNKVRSIQYIYSKIATKYYTTSLRVELAIRHAIEISWEWKGENKLNNYFPNQPSNTEFLNFMYRWISMECKLKPNI